LKVLHVYRTYFPDTQGGLEEAVRQICRGAKRFGVESRVLTLSDNPTPAIIEFPEATVIRARKNIEPLSCSMGVGMFAEFRRQAAWADLIHVQFPWPFADLVYLMSGIEKPTIITYQSDVVRQRLLNQCYRPLMKAFFRHADRIVATSDNYVASSTELQAYRDRLEVIPLGLDEKSYPAPSEVIRHRVEQRFGRDFMLFVGVLRYYKGLHFLLDAMCGAPYELVIAGSGPVEVELKKQAQELGLTNVHFAGFVDDDTKVVLFELCRGVVFPSFLRSEAYGVTLLEASMFGKPMISAEIGTGTSYINQHEQTGIVVKPGDSVELRYAMDMLQQQPLRANEMGRAASERYQTLFTGELMGQRYASLYRKVLDESVGSAHEGKSLV
jgi:rhamnosyl/mannosyltransferase